METACDEILIELKGKSSIPLILVNKCRKYLMGQVHVCL